MASFLFVVHGARAEASELADKTAAWLRGDGHKVFEALSVEFPQTDQAVEQALPPGLDLVVSLGGDGTMLRAVQLASPAGIPVVGVNLGRLGFLTQLEPDELQAGLESFLQGRAKIENRTTLQVLSHAPGEEPAVICEAALNEAVVEKTLPGHTVRLGVSLDSEPFNSYVADGLIVATATGSTAYNLSARGPLLSPTLDALVLTPNSPHMLFDRALVLDPTTEIRIEVLGPRPAVLVVDGVAKEVLSPGKSVICSKGRFPARLATFSHNGFHAVLKSKFSLADR